MLDDEFTLDKSFGWGASLSLLNDPDGKDEVLFALLCCDSGLLSNSSLDVALGRPLLGALLLPGVLALMLDAEDWLSSLDTCTKYFFSIPIDQ